MVAPEVQAPEEVMLAALAMYYEAQDHVAAPVPLDDIARHWKLERDGYRMWRTAKAKEFLQRYVRAPSPATSDDAELATRSRRVKASLPNGVNALFWCDGDDQTMAVQAAADWVASSRDKP
ncbi:hypothetical protein EHM76_05085 [bacterium]|nr:MAG: hypothetical protein EHM76_05085 [bacterium]